MLIDDAEPARTALALYRARVQAPDWPAKSPEEMAGFLREIVSHQAEVFFEGLRDDAAFILGPAWPTKQ
jgi:hypothetical protein